MQAFLQSGITNSVIVQTVTSIVENIMTAVYETDGVGDACDTCFVSCSEDTGICEQLQDSWPASIVSGERWYSNQTTCEGFGTPAPVGFHCTDGYPMLNFTSANPDPVHLERVYMFWSFNGAALGVCTLCEIAGLYYFGLLNAVRVANCIDMRLLPMNRDRASVAQSLIRAALELGQSNIVSRHIDPMLMAQQCVLIRLRL